MQLGSVGIDVAKMQLSFSFYSICIVHFVLVLGNQPGCPFCQDDALFFLVDFYRSDHSPPDTLILTPLFIYFVSLGIFFFLLMGKIDLQKGLQTTPRSQEA